jgi:hypothetical protein
MEIQPGQDLLELFAPPETRPSMKVCALQEAKKIGELTLDPETFGEWPQLERRLRRLRALYGPEVERAFESGRAEGFRQV